jgi:hypothetical protein
MDVSGLYPSKLRYCITTAIFRACRSKIDQVHFPQLREVGDCLSSVRLKEALLRIKFGLASLTRSSERAAFMVSMADLLIPIVLFQGPDDRLHREAYN